MGFYSCVCGEVVSLGVVRWEWDGVVGSSLLAGNENLGKGG